MKSIRIQKISSVISARLFKIKCPIKFDYYKLMGLAFSEFIIIIIHILHVSPRWATRVPKNVVSHSLSLPPSNTHTHTYLYIYIIDFTLDAKANRFSNVSFRCFINLFKKYSVEYSTESAKKSIFCKSEKNKIFVN
jgi:hypothetical protein